MNRTKIVSKSKKFSKSKNFQIFSGNHFSPRFMTPCSLLNENIFFGFLKSAPTPRYTILDSRLPLCNTSSEAGALLPAIRGTYRNMTLTKKILSQNFFRFFLETTFLHFFMIPCSLLIENIFSVKISQHFFQVKIFQIFFWKPRFMIPCSLLIVNIFSVFRSPQLPLDTQFWTRCLPFANWLKN